MQVWQRKRQGGVCLLPMDHGTESIDFRSCKGTCHAVRQTSLASTAEAPQKNKKKKRRLSLSSQTCRSSCKSRAVPSDSSTTIRSVCRVGCKHGFGAGGKRGRKRGTVRPQKYQKDRQRKKTSSCYDERMMGRSGSRMTTSSLFFSFFPL